LSMVMTVRDFSIVFDTYALFEESMLTAKLQLRGELGEAVAADTDDLDETGDDVDLRLARLERLMEHRPQLLSLVLLRQNPHNVYEWHKRAKVRARFVTRLHGRVRHSVAICGQLLLFCDQSMREKAWRSRKRGALATRAPYPACRGGRRASRSDTLAASQTFSRMQILC
jgi:hypothetical protein